ncbi:MAG: phenylalanine--tRNA ligase beta subunit-related protein [Hyphomonadaceae bacterium]
MIGTSKSRRTALIDGASLASLAISPPPASARPTKAVLPVPGRYPSPQKVEIDDLNACPMFASRYIRGVKNGPSPLWLQQKLRAIGQKPISALVDPLPIWVDPRPQSPGARL